MDWGENEESAAIFNLKLPDRTKNERITKIKEGKIPKKNLLKSKKDEEEKFIKNLKSPQLWNFEFADLPKFVF